MTKCVVHRPGYGSVLPPPGRIPTARTAPASAQNNLPAAPLSFLPSRRIHRHKGADCSTRSGIFAPCVHSVPLRKARFCQHHYITYPAHFPACDHSGNAGIPHCRCDFLAFSACGRFLRRCLASLTVHDLIFPSYPGLAGRSARSDGLFSPQALPPGGMASVPQPLRFRAEPACSPAARYTTGLFSPKVSAYMVFGESSGVPATLACASGEQGRGDKKRFTPFFFRNDML